MGWFKKRRDESAEFTPEMIAEAKKNPGGNVYKIDWNYPDDQKVPPEAIVGAYEVDDAGNLTGVFHENDNYRAIVSAKRQPQNYMLECIKGTSEFNGQWVVEADPSVHDSFPNFPKEWQIGSWYVGDEGEFTGQFRPNAKYIGDIET